MRCQPGYPRGGNHHIRERDDEDVVGGPASHRGGGILRRCVGQACHLIDRGGGGPFLPSFRGVFAEYQRSFGLAGGERGARSGAGGRRGLRGGIDRRCVRFRPLRNLAADQRGLCCLGGKRQRFVKLGHARRRTLAGRAGDCGNPILDALLDPALPDREGGRRCRRAIM